jgi:hypothetical protein
MKRHAWGGGSQMASGFLAGSTEVRRYLTYLLLQLIFHRQHRDAEDEPAS